MTYATQTGNGDELNRLYEGDLPVHEWYRFVLSFPPHLVRDYVSKFSLKSSDWVLDPFCGTGTTIVECKKHGIASVGLEANPVVQYLAQTKCDWDLNPNRFVENAKFIAQIANERIKADGLQDDPIFLELDRPIAGSLRELSDDESDLLIMGSMSPKPLHKSLVLREAICEYADPRFFDHFRLAFAKELVVSVSNLRFGPEVGMGKRKIDTPVVDPWMRAVRKIAEDVQRPEIMRFSRTPAFVRLGDSRHIDRALEPLSFNAVITSPPYPNEKDYTRTTRLESVMLGFMRTKRQLRDQKKNLIRSNTRGVYKADEDDKWLNGNTFIEALANDIEKRRIEMGKTSGFERLYHRVVKLYFGGMAKHLMELRRILAPGAKLAYVVGDQASYLRIMIRTGHILASIAESLGYEVEDIDLFRTRFSTATQENLNEEVVVLRWLS